MSEGWVDCLMEEYFNQSDKEKKDQLPVGKHEIPLTILKKHARYLTMGLVIVPLFQITVPKFQITIPHFQITGSQYQRTIPQFEIKPIQNFK